MKSIKTDCVFCQIISSKINADIIYEDSHTVAFLDINPISPGHTLVVSKEHYSEIEDIPHDNLHYMMNAIQKIVPHVKKITSSEGSNILQNNNECAGQAIAHLHYHIIPRKKGDTIQFRWKPKRYGPGEREKISDLLREKLK